MLHFAPEACFRRRLAAVSSLSYATADIDSPLADFKVDIQALPFEDRDFDTILCSHVLEHVPDDRSAMRELRRILRPQGLLIVNVPLKGPKTFENPQITSPAQRRIHFGQEDHVRYYGLDIVDRLREAGLTVEIERYYERFDPHVRFLFGFNREVFFLCRRAET